MICSLFSKLYDKKVYGACDVPRPAYSTILAIMAGRQMRVVTGFNHHAIAASLGVRHLSAELFYLEMGRDIQAEHGEGQGVKGELAAAFQFDGTFDKGAAQLCVFGPEIPGFPVLVIVQIDEIQEQLVFLVQKQMPGHEIALPV